MGKFDEKGISIEVLGTCTTNTTPGSQHIARVEYHHLWSYAQQAALIAVSDKNNNDGCYHLITDPERRAKRIAGHYAWLYFESAKKSTNKVQLYWPALAAFVVKDIVEAYRFAREDVLHRDWRDLASVARNSAVADLGSLLMTEDSPYQHALRTYSALAKGNLWLFMDIYPWLWFFIEYGLNRDGRLNKQRLSAAPPERNWNTFQRASKLAVDELPYGPKWMGRLADRLANDVVYKQARECFTSVPAWTGDGGYGQRSAMSYRAHAHCRTRVKDYDRGYRTPPSAYWGKFKEAFYVMESEHAELGRLVRDKGRLATLEKIRMFCLTKAISTTYESLVKEYDEGDLLIKRNFQKAELVAIAEQEQINVLQPLIYNDPLLRITMDMNHRFSRLTNGWLSPKFKVIYSAAATNSDPELETVFDAPRSLIDQFSGPIQSLPSKQDRMKFVADIAFDFNQLMDTKRAYMDGELRKILAWVNA